MLATHCTENRIYVFPEKDLLGPSPNSYIHVSVSDLSIPRIGPHMGQYSYPARYSKFTGVEGLRE
jgi:hypothetical protein